LADLTVIILTYNEEKHIQRCIESLKNVAKKIILVDSFSNDQTLTIAKELGAEIYQNTFINHAVQFQWGLDNCTIPTQWVMKMDADEYVTPELATEIKQKLANIKNEINGIYVKRRVVFLGKWIKNGSYYPTWLLRIWRNKTATVEQRWMDEHIKLEDGKTTNFENDIVDENLNNLAWWTTKHNNYSTKEAIEMLNIEYDICSFNGVKPDLKGTQEQRKRWLKKKYSKLPLFARPLIYFLWRYFIKLGFLDGKQGLIWHSLQGLWYRMLVDAKVFEIKRTSRLRNISISEAIDYLYKIKLNQ
jgi:glycosyltransferase involved in cell wall biosynthesis